MTIDRKIRQPVGQRHALQRNRPQQNGADRHPKPRRRQNGRQRAISSRPEARNSRLYVDRQPESAQDGKERDVSQVLTRLPTDEGKHQDLRPVATLSRGSEARDGRCDQRHQRPENWFSGSRGRPFRNFGARLSQRLE